MADRARELFSDSWSGMEEAFGEVLASAVGSLLRSSRLVYETFRKHLFLALWHAAYGASRIG